MRAEELYGGLHLTVPALLQAKVLILEFGDLQHSTARLENMRLIYLESSGFCEDALEAAFAQRGLRLNLCQLSKELSWLFNDPVQYTCMHISGYNGAKVRAVDDVPCICGACYECVLSRIQLD